MKKILSNLMLISFCSTMLTACFFGSCADWNCTKLNPHWVKAVDVCNAINNATVLRELGYKFSYTSTAQVQDSEIGLHISGQCSRNGGKYDIRKDKQYGHLFVK